MTDDLEPRLRDHLARRAPATVPDELLERVARLPQVAPRPPLLRIPWLGLGTARAGSPLAFAVLLASLLGLMVLTVGMVVLSRPSLLSVQLPSVGPLVVARDGPGVAMLPDGRVLVAGGYDPQARRSSTATDLYDPATGRFTATGPMQTRRANPVMAILDDGMVLIAGGADDAAAPPELFDPSAGAWRTLAVPDPPLDAVRAARLQDGDVLLATSARLIRFSPADRTFRVVADVTADTLTTLADGTVLAIAWDEDDDGTVPAWLFDPVGSMLAPIAPLPGSGEPDSYGVVARALPHHGASSALLPDGQVLIVGGYANADGPTPVADTHLFDPVTRAFALGEPLAVGRSGPAVLPLADGRVLVAGGEVAGRGSTGGGPPRLVPTDMVEVYDPATHRFAVSTPMTAARHWLTATPVAQGIVLIVGTDAADDPSAELYRVVAE